MLTDHKSADLIGALDGFNVEMRKNLCKRLRKFWSLISAVGEQRLQKWKHAEQCRHHENATIAILNVGRMDDGVEQETYCGLKFPRFPESDFKIFGALRSMMIG